MLANDLAPAEPEDRWERRQRLLGIVDELGPAFRERAPRYDREASFPFENFADLYEAGFYGLCIPTRYGGLGASFNDYMHIGAAIGAKAETERNRSGLLSASISASAAITISVAPITSSLCGRSLRGSRRR